MNVQEFAGPFAALCVAYGREASEELTEVYLGVLRAVDAATWRRIANEQLASGDRFMPPPGVLLERARGTDEASLRAEAHEALRRALRIEDYDPEHGTRISERRVRELLGPAAAEALAECGGGYAILAQEDHWIEAKWTPAYVRARRADPKRCPALPEPRAGEAACRMIAARSDSSGPVDVKSLLVEIDDAHRARELAASRP